MDLKTALCTRSSTSISRHTQLKSCSPQSAIQRGGCKECAPLINRQQIIIIAWEWMLGALNSVIIFLVAHNNRRTQCALYSGSGDHHHHQKLNTKKGQIQTLAITCSHIICTLHNNESTSVTRSKKWNDANICTNMQVQIKLLGQRQMEQKSCAEVKHWH